MATETREIIVQNKGINLIHHKYLYENTAVLEIIRPKAISDAPSRDCAQPHASQLLVCLLSALCRVLYPATEFRNFRVNKEI